MTTTNITTAMTKIVEITRSKYGYGFTLSGEKPCRLTQVKGHASLAGLASNDKLITVNGENVEHRAHEEVVNIITSALNGRLTMMVKPRGLETCELSDDDDPDASKLMDTILPPPPPPASSSYRRYGSSLDDRTDEEEEENGDSSTSSSSASRYGYINGCVKYDVTTVAPTHNRRHRGHQAPSCGSNRRRANNRASQPSSNILRPSQVYEPVRVSSIVAPRKQSPRTSRANKLASRSQTEINKNDREDELLLHQHYRNRLKSSRAKETNLVNARVSSEALDLDSKPRMLKTKSKDNLASIVKNEPRAGDRRPIDLSEMNNDDGGHLHHRSLCSLNQLEVQVDVHPQPAAQHHHQLDYGRTRYLKDLKLSLFKDKHEDSVDHYHHYVNTPTRALVHTNSTTSGVSSTSPSGCSSSSTSPSSTATRSNNIVCDNALLDHQMTLGSCSPTTMEDNHSQAILRAIVYCLSITKHRFELEQRANSAAITDIIRRQLAQASRSAIGNLDDLLPVLVAIYTDRLVLASADAGETEQQKLPKINYSIKSSQIVQCALLPKDKAYFVLLIDDEQQGERSTTTSGSFSCCRCFVFLVDRNMSRSHRTHQHLAQRFGLLCIADPIETSNCLEFPENSEQIVRVIYSLFRKQFTLARTEETRALDGFDDPGRSNIVEDLRQFDNKQNDLVAPRAGLQSRVQSQGEPRAMKTLPSTTRETVTIGAASPGSVAVSTGGQCALSHSATTSCDSFSYQQFGQHLLHQCEREEKRDMRVAVQHQASSQCEPKRDTGCATTRKAIATTSIPGVCNHTARALDAKVVTNREHAQFNIRGHSHRTTNPSSLLSSPPGTVLHQTCQQQPSVLSGSDRSVTHTPATVLHPGHSNRVASDHPQSQATTPTWLSCSTNLNNVSSVSSYELHRDHVPSYLGVQFANVASGWNGQLTSPHHSSYLDLSSHQLEAAQFNAQSVRQATERYLRAYLGGRPSNCVEANSPLNRTTSTLALYPAPSMANNTESSNAMSSSGGVNKKLTPDRRTISQSIDTIYAGGGETKVKHTATMPSHRSFEQNASASVSASTSELVNNAIQWHQQQVFLPDMLETVAEVPHLLEISAAHKSPNRSKGEDKSVAKVLDSSLSSLSSSPPPKATSKLSRKLAHLSEQWSSNNSVLIEPERPVSERAIDVGTVGTWSNDFDTLLADPLGLSAFMSYLKEAYSSENLQFYLMVQDFKKLTDPEQIKAKAHEIYETFISSEAENSLNIDCKAQRSIRNTMDKDAIDNELFALAEEQVYQLMKMDCYHRFLKSDTYKKCAQLEAASGINAKTLNDKTLNGDKNKDKSSNSKNNRKSYVTSTWMETFNKIRKNGKFASTFSLSKSESKASESQSTSETSSPKPSVSLETTTTSPAPAPTSSAVRADAKQRYQAFAISKIKNTFKIRSKSLDEPFGNHPALKQIEGQGGSVDKQILIQQSLNLGDSHASLGGNSNDSTDNVFSPSPDPHQCAEAGQNSPESNDCHCAAMVGGSTSQSETDSPTSRHLFHNSFDHNCGREDCHFIRMTFPEYHAQTVVPPLAAETLNHLVLRTIDRKSFKYIAFDVYVTGSDKGSQPLNLLAQSQEFGCRELRIEKRVIFQIAFPSGESIGVKAKTNRLVSEVIDPILNFFDYRVEHIKMFTVSGGQQQQLLPDQPIIQLDAMGQCVRIVYSEDLQEYGWDTTRTRVPVALKSEQTSPKTENIIQTKLGDKEQINFGDFSFEMINDANRDFYTNGNRSLKPDFIDQTYVSIYEAKTSYNSSFMGESEDTLSDAFFAEIVKSNHQRVPSPLSRSPNKVTTTASVAYGIVASPITPRCATKSSSCSPLPPPTHVQRANSMSAQRSKPLFEKCSVRNRSNLASGEMDHDETLPNLNQADGKITLRNLQNHRHFQTAIDVSKSEPASRVSPVVNETEAEHIAPPPEWFADPAPPLPPRNAPPASLLLHSQSAPVPPPRSTAMPSSVSCPMGLPSSAPAVSRPALFDSDSRRVHNHHHHHHHHHLAHHHFHGPERQSSDPTAPL